MNEREFAPEQELVAVEQKFHDTEFKIFSLHTEVEDAKAAGAMLFESLPGDKDGDGVRIRNCKLTSEGLEFVSRVWWQRLISGTADKHRSIEAMRAALQSG